MATAQRPVLTLGDAPLDCAALVAAGRGETRVALDDGSWRRIAESRAVIEEMIASGAPGYGITTGVGSQKDYEVSAVDAAEYNTRLVAAHATRVPGPLLPPHRVRAAMAVLLNHFASGFSGVSEDLARLILDRINTAETMPEIDASGSVGASDLVPLAQIAHWLLTSPEAKAAELPKAKETLSLINCNAVTLAAGAEILLDAQRLMAAFDLAAAAAQEGFRANLDAISEPVNAAHRRAGQRFTAARMRALLAGSDLWSGGARFLQDPLSFRCASQAHGAAHELVDRALDVWNEELNSVNDNPITDLDTGGVRSHGNMDTTRVTLAVDGVRQALAKVADLAGERLHKQQWPAFSGLPTGLADEAKAIGGVQFLNLGHIASSLITSAKIWARPHLLTSVGQVADGVEDTAGHALHAVHDLERLVDAGWKIAAIEMAVAVWAMRRRRLAPETLGRGVRVAYDRLSPMLPIGVEGREVFSLTPLIAAVREGDLVEAALSVSEAR